MNVEDILLGLGELDASFLDRIQGVSEERIAELEGYLGHSVPDVYRQLLRLAGDDLGGVAEGVYSMSFPRVLKAARRHRRRPGPGRFTLIGFDLGEIGNDLYLDSEQTGSEETPLLRGLPYNDPPLPVDEWLSWGVSIHPPTLPEFIYHEGFIRLGMAKRAARGRGAKMTTDVLPKRARGVLEDLGFHQTRASSERSAYFVRHDAQVAVTSPVDVAMVVQVFAWSPQEVRRILRALDRRLGLDDVRNP